MKNEVEGTNTVLNKCAYAMYRYRAAEHDTIVSETNALIFLSRSFNAMSLMRTVRLDTRSAESYKG